MAIKRRDVQHNRSIRDALLNTEEGQRAVFQAKKQTQEIGQRIRQLKELVHSTFVGNVPRGFNKRFDVYQSAKTRVRDIGIQGGPVYDRALLRIKFAWTSREAFKEAVDMVTE